MTTLALVVVTIALAGAGARARTPADGAAVSAAVAWDASPRPVERARAGYLAAMFRARAARSADGVRKACEGFAALGDTDVAAACGRVARDIEQAQRRTER